jgi:hypothetical protein
MALPRSTNFAVLPVVRCSRSLPLKGLFPAAAKRGEKKDEAVQLRMLQGFITCHLPFGPLTKPYFAAVSGLPKMALW